MLARNLISKANMQLLYYAHVYSHLMYGLTSWGSMISKKDLNLIAKTQTKCISIINGEKAPSDQMMYKELQLVRFEDMIRTELIKLGFKITSKILPNPLIFAFEQDGDKKLILTTPEINPCQTYKSILKIHTIPALCAKPCPNIQKRRRF